MNCQRNQIEKIEQVLLQAGRHVKTVTPGTKWQANLMRQVRLAGPIAGRNEDAASYGRVVWKVAFSAATCAAVLFILAEKKGGTDSYVSARTELNNSFEYMLADAF